MCVCVCIHHTEPGITIIISQLLVRSSTNQPTPLQRPKRYGIDTIVPVAATSAFRGLHTVVTVSLYVFCSYVYTHPKYSAESRSVTASEMRVLISASKTLATASPPFAI